ncbi:MAG: alpha-glucan family phosphorylase, partial [Betaproteobacteria bacterium]
MRPIRTFVAVPALPPRLEGLRDLAINLRWAWDSDTVELFRRLDSDLWEATGHDPVWLLGTIDQRRLDETASDEAFVAHLDRVREDLTAYLASSTTWFGGSHGPAGAPAVAYFSAEFGVTECLSIFAGGLGVLAGDHLKSASDLGVPLCGVGLLYQDGYFEQYINEAGWQQESYRANDFHTLPLTLARAPNGAATSVEVPIGTARIRARVWLAQVGRIPLYLLDTNTPENAPTDRAITAQLYGGDQETRLKQEIVLGIGGHRALHAAGVEPSVFHLNEGHSAFLALEQIARLMSEHGLAFD